MAEETVVQIAQQASPSKARKRAKPTKARSRIYTRTQGGETRYYADFRNVGGSREALKAKGESRATTDPTVAEKLAADRLTELMTSQRDRVFGKKESTTLKAFAAQHLVQKVKSGKYTELWLGTSERMLRIATEYFGADRELTSITVRDVTEYANHLTTVSNGRGGVLNAGTIRHHLNVLSNLYDRAQTEDRVDLGYNPVARMTDKPEGNPDEAHWLEVHEAALFLESARTYVAKRPESSLPCVYPLIATFLLTGGRESEVYGLEISDVNFDRKTVTFRPNQWRRLKTQGSHRVVPLWPQLETILRDYIKQSGRKTGLLFPSPCLEEPGMITDIRKVLDAIAVRTERWTAGEIRTKSFRHTYTAARLQTLDNGAPVALFTVSRELGHADTDMVSGVYGHLGDVKHRAEVVEFRVSQHRAKLKTHLKLLKSA
jgi:integrase